LGGGGVQKEKIVTKKTRILEKKKTEAHGRDERFGNSLKKKEAAEWAGDRTKTGKKKRFIGKKIISPEYVFGKS